MFGLLTSLARGFWQRVIGLVASNSASVDRVREIALTLPTSTSISADEASTLLDLANGAMSAAKEWYEGKIADELEIPKVPWTQFPSINGDEPGKYQFGLVINSPTTEQQGEPVFFSDNEITDVEKVLGNLYNYIAEGQGRDTVTFYQDLLVALQENRRDALIPLWLYEYISPENYKGPQ